MKSILENFFYQSDELFEEFPQLKDEILADSKLSEIYKKMEINEINDPLVDAVNDACVSARKAGFIHGFRSCLQMFTDSGNV